MFSDHSLTHFPASREETSDARRPLLPGWIAALLARIGRRLQPAGRVLHVEERLMLGGRKSVTLIVCHGRRFLLASSGDALAPLVEVRSLDDGPSASAQDQECS